MVKIKHKDFIGAVPIMPCEKSSWIMGLRIYREGRTQNPRVHLLRYVLCQGSRRDRVYTNIDTHIKIAKNTKINHIMVSFTDHYNAISVNLIAISISINVKILIM